MGEFVGFCTIGACTVIPVNPVVAKLDEMALVAVELDNDVAMAAPETDGGAMTVYFTETPVTFRA